MLAYTLHIQDEFLPKALQLLSSLPNQSFFLEPMINNQTQTTLSPEQQRLIASQTLAQLGKHGKIGDIISPIN